jgi:hypothetical protein
MVRSPCPGGYPPPAYRSVEDEKLTLAGDSSHIGEEFML